MAKKAEQKQGYGDDKPEEIPRPIQRHVSHLLACIDRAKDLRKTFETETLPKLRRYTWGTRHGEQSGSESSARTNLVYATIATLLPHIYAKNPEIAVAPTEAVGKGEYQRIKEFCKTAQVMLNNVLVEEARLKRRMKSNVRATMTTSVGWIKMSFQESLKGDPLIIRRINDAQDNIRHIEALIQKADKSTDLDEQGRLRLEAQTALKGLMNSPEVKIFKGFAIDRVKTEDIFILDESIVEFDEYADAKQIAHRIWMTDDDYCETFGKKPTEGAIQYGQPAPNDLTDDAGEKVTFGNNAEKTNYRAVYEVWDRTTNMIYTVCEGVKGYCRDPFPLSPSSQRWYSFFALGFNQVEGRWRPISDVELLMRLQDEYNTTRTLFAETRKEAIPVRVFRKNGGLTQADIEALVNRKSREFIGVEGNPSVPINQDLMQLDGIKIDPEAFDVTLIRNDMDMLVGLSDASRANLMQAKTATEAEIMRQALMTRVAERQDTVEDMISEMALSALEIMLQKFTLEEVKQIVGEGAVWPEQMERETIFHKVRVSVRAGSTGKPNILKERESWAQIMPILNDTMTQVAELRMQGHFDLANSKIELLKETLQRYDEKIDVDRFIPQEEFDESGQRVQQQNAMMQAQQAQEQLQLMQAELQKLQQANQQLEQQLMIAKNNDATKAAEVQANSAIEAARETSKQEQARLDAEARAQEAQAKRADDMERERLKHESAERMHEKTLANQRRIELMKAAAQVIAQASKPGPDGETSGADTDAIMRQLEQFAEVVPDAEGMAGGAAGPRQMEVVQQMTQMFVEGLAAIADKLSQPKQIDLQKQADGRVVATSRPFNS